MMPLCLSQATCVVRGVAVDALAARLLPAPAAASAGLSTLRKHCQPDPAAQVAQARGRPPPRSTWACRRALSRASWSRATRSTPGARSRKHHPRPRRLRPPSARSSAEAEELLALNEGAGLASSTMLEQVSVRGLVRDERGQDVAPVGPDGRPVAKGKVGVRESGQRVDSLETAHVAEEHEEPGAGGAGGWQRADDVSHADEAGLKSQGLVGSGLGCCPGGLAHGARHAICRCGAAGEGSGVAGLAHVEQASVTDVAESLVQLVQRPLCEEGVAAVRGRMRVAQILNSIQGETVIPIPYSTIVNDWTGK
jgi:hypothetical protein